MHASRGCTAEAQAQRQDSTIMHTSGVYCLLDFRRAEKKKKTKDGRFGANCGGGAVPS